MKKIRFLGILLAITVFATYSLSINVLANDVCNASESYLVTDVSELSGIIHEDGSYQFSERELARLNIYTSNCNEMYNLKEAIAYAAPQFYQRLTVEAQEVLEKAEVRPVESRVSTYAHASHDVAFLSGCTTQISKYGNSLKGVATIKRKNTTNIPIEFDGYYVVNQIYNDQDYRVGYSVNVSMEPDVSATTIIDPPSGSYVSEGIFEIPYNCPQCFRWTRMSAKAEHGPISYRNPYE